MNIPESILSQLTDEQKKKVEAAATPEDLLAIAKEAGHELSMDQLDAIAGGKEICWQKCLIVCHTDCKYTDPF